MCTVARAMIPRLRAWVSNPLLVLAVVCVLSLDARTALIGQPCQSPCTTASDHTLIFDEAYYVNAARVIAGIHPTSGSHYADAPLGTDPNAEHPQLAKLIMAGSIELFGDGPLAWRIGSLVMGTIAVLGMYALVRAAGGGRWTAVGASALMASDNLLLVHGRIGTLDIYAVAAMIWCVTLYLRGRPVLAGLALAVAAAFKLVAPYVLVALVLLELGRILVGRHDPDSPQDRRPLAALRRLLICGFTGAGVFMGLLAVMGQIATPYNDAGTQLITGGPFDHFAHMVSYASGLVSPHGPQGIASYPWDWLADTKVINYLRVNPSLPGDSLNAIHPVSKFLGMVSPPILALGVLAVPLAAVRAVRVPRRGDADLALVGLAWFLGTWLPFVVLSLLDQRTSYLYYMVVVMPGLYITASWLASRIWQLDRRWSRPLLGIWTAAVLAAAVLMYPFTPVF
ncbi:MAG: glycosyltransferase family 39 protein [Actinomycetota bacterium]|nr:glycosyltransferase family 39 protein [Actinomycetota bacterium]